MDYTYLAEISRDEEAGVWYVSDTNFPGLVAEASSERELQDKIRALVHDPLCRAKPFVRPTRVQFDAAWHVPRNRDGSTNVSASSSGWPRDASQSALSRRLPARQRPRRQVRDPRRLRQHQEARVV